MDFKEELKKVGAVATPKITWADCQDELMNVINKRNSEYAEEFKKARVQEAQLRFNKFIEDNPKKEGEDDEAYKARIISYVNDYINEAPEEMTRNMRIMCNLEASLFNQMNWLTSTLSDFVELWKAANEDKLIEYAQKHAEEIKKQQEAYKQAQENQARHERAVARKEAVKAKCRKK